MEVASPEGWRKNMEAVLEFYNQRRRQLLEVKPNAGHYALVELEKKFEVSIITQNIDDLHERAGSSRIIHLHGELLKARSTKDPSIIYEWAKDINPGDTCPLGSQLRPHIVWFGEAVPMIEMAAMETMTADAVIIIGTSMQVYPAAGLVDFAEKAKRIFYVDPKPAINYELSRAASLSVVAESATAGVPKVVKELLEQ